MHSRVHSPEPQPLVECLAGINRGKLRHSLARAVYAPTLGRIHDRSDAVQQKRAMALNLALAAIEIRRTSKIGVRAW